MDFSLERMPRGAYLIEYSPSNNVFFRRAFATGCFKPECLIDDLTGLDEKEMQEIDRWVAFYEKEYIYVGDLKK